MSEDTYEKLGMAVLIVILVMVIAMFGVGIWGFVELVQWLKSQ